MNVGLWGLIPSVMFCNFGIYLLCNFVFFVTILKLKIFGNINCVDNNNVHYNYLKITLVMWVL